MSAFGIGAIFTGDMLGLCYLYAKIDVDQYQMATGIVTAAIQLGKVVGDFSAQIIVNATGGIYTILPYCNVFSNQMIYVFKILYNFSHSQTQTIHD